MGRRWALDGLATAPRVGEEVGEAGWSDAVMVLADEVRAHLVRRELDGRSVALPGRTGRFAAVYLARTALAEVEQCLRDPSERGVTVSAARWRELAERLRIIEGAVHAAG